MGALSNIDPTAVAVWASAVVLFALIAVLRAVFKLNFSLLTVLALGLGIALSLVFDGQVDSLNLLGNIYINLITALVAPLIFVSIISSITYVGSLKKLRSIGLRSVGWLLLTNLIAIVMTLGVAIPLHIGSGVKLVDDESTAGFLTSQTAPLDQVILNFFPKNIVGDLSGNRVVPIIITATVLAIAIVSVGRQKDVSVVKRFFEQTKGVIYKAVGYVVELTPYAVVVLGATSTAATTSKADALLALLSILVLGFVLNIIQAFVVNGLLLKFVAHVPPLTFFKAVLPAQATAFATQSSVATLPLSIRQLGTVGVGADVANFTTPIGTTIGMPGCAGVWPMLSAVFTINALGLGYSPVSYVALAVIGLLSSIGTAGVPGTAIVTATTVSPRLVFRCSFWCRWCRSATSSACRARWRTCPLRSHARRSYRGRPGSSTRACWIRLVPGGIAIARAWSCRRLAGRLRLLSFLLRLPSARWVLRRPSSPRPSRLESVRPISRCSRDSR